MALKLRTHRSHSVETNGDGTTDDLSVAGRELTPRSGLRLRPRRPWRLLLGGLLVLLTTSVAVTVYSRIGDRVEVLALSRTVLAGEQISDADLKVVSISSDDGFASVPASDRSWIVGRYARVRMLEGSLLVEDSVQQWPLVDPDKVLMAVETPAGRVPVGLREGSRLTLVVTRPGSSDQPPALVEATVAAIPRNLADIVGEAGDGSFSSAMVSLSVEVAPEDAGVVGTASDVTVGVVDPLRGAPPSDAPDRHDDDDNDNDEPTDGGDERDGDGG